MAQVIKAQLTEGAEAAVSFFNSLNCPLITARVEGSDSFVNINGVFEIKNITKRNDVRLYQNGTQVVFFDNGYTPNPYCTVLYDDDCVFIWVCSSASGWTNKSFGVFYKRVGQKDLFGYRQGDGLTSDIVNYVLYDNDTSLAYKITTVFKDYTPNVDCLDYTKAYLFIGDLATTKSNDEVLGFLDCSTVTLFSVISFSGKNYFAIGTHILVELND